MARNGSGGYSLASGNPVVTGTTISSTTHNNTMSDIATAIADSLTKNGEAVISGDQDFNGNAIILDLDGDTKVEASTDDQIDVTIGGALELSLTAAKADNLDDIAALTPTDDYVLYGDGTDWTAVSMESAITAELLDEDDLSSDSDTQAATQQSIKAYIDGLIAELTGRNVIAPHDGLVLTLGGTPDEQVDIDADAVLLKDSSGAPYRAESVDLTVDITSSGANGLDTGSVAADTWYYAFVIYNGTTVAGLLSTSSSSPTMPSGYTYKGLVGAALTDGDGDFIYQFQNGESVVVNQADNVKATAANYGSLTEVDFGDLVPPIATKIHLYMEQSGVGGNQGTHDVAIDSSGNGTLTYQTHNTVSGRTSQNDWLVLNGTSLWFERKINTPALTLAVLGWSYA